MADNQSDSAPSRHQSASSRLLGVYPQRQSGLFMQRIKILGGRINWPQWRRVTEFAARYSAGFPLHVTTRQDIELHNIIEKNLAVVQQNLAEVGLTTFGAGGDTVRNITVCTGCDFCPGGFDLSPIAHLVRQHLEGLAVALSLPRKFKISFSGCGKACARPWLNDLGFIAQVDGQCAVIGGGSLGPRPALGVELYRDMPARDILPFCIAAVEFFAEYGDRRNRHRARLRHVREKFGDETFKMKLDERFRQVRLSRTWPELSPPAASKDTRLLYRLQLPNGNVTPAQVVALADAAEPKGAVLRINFEHGLEVYGMQPVRLSAELAALANGPAIVSCPGTATCSRGLVDCWATAEQIRKILSGHNLADVRINISGCPNNCGQSTVADIGLVGLVRKENEQFIQCYRLFTGGGNGMNERLALPGAIVRTEKVPEVIFGLLK